MSKAGLADGLPAGWRRAILGGRDAIDLTLRQRPAIDAFREADRLRRPWIYLPLEAR